MVTTPTVAALYGRSAFEALGRGNAHVGLLVIESSEDAKSTGSACSRSVAARPSRDWIARDCSSGSGEGCVRDLVTLAASFDPTRCRLCEGADDADRPVDAAVSASRARSTPPAGRASSALHAAGTCWVDPAVPRNAADPYGSGSGFAEVVTRSPSPTMPGCFSWWSVTRRNRREPACATSCGARRSSCSRTSNRICTEDRGSGALG